MSYFLLTLLFKIIIVLFCLLGCFFTIKKIIKKEVKKIYYLLIIILLPSAIYLFSFDTIPYIKDIPYIKNKNYKTIEGYCSNIIKTKNQNSIILNNKEFNYNPWDFTPRVNKKYKLYYVPNSNFIINYNSVE